MNEFRNAAINVFIVKRRRRRCFRVAKVHFVWGGKFIVRCLSQKEQGHKEDDDDDDDDEDRGPRSHYPLDEIRALFIKKRATTVKLFG